MAPATAFLTNCMLAKVVMKYKFDLIEYNNHVNQNYVVLCEVL